MNEPLSLRNSLNAICYQLNYCVNCGFFLSPVCENNWETKYSKSNEGRQDNNG